MAPSNKMRLAIALTELAMTNQWDPANDLQVATNEGLIDCSDIKKETVASTCIKKEPTDFMAEEPAICFSPGSIKHEELILPTDFITEEFPDILRCIKQEPDAGVDDFYVQEDRMLINNNTPDIGDLNIQIEEGTVPLSSAPRNRESANSKMPPLKRRKISENVAKVAEKSVPLSSTPLKQRLRKRKMSDDCPVIKKLSKTSSSSQITVETPSEKTEESISNEVEKLLEVALAQCSNIKCRKETKVLRYHTKCVECRQRVLYVCGPCNKPLKTYKNLSLHLRTEHVANSKIYACTLCPSKFAQLKRLNFHIKVKHGV